MTSHPRLDRVRLVARFEDDVSFFEQVAAIFIADCPRMSDALSAALLQGDLEAIRKAAHGIKGGAGNFVDDGIVDEAAAVEELARDRQPRAFAAGIHLGASLEAFRLALQGAAKAGASGS